MADKTNHTSGATTFAAASTPLPNVYGAEPSYVVSVQILEAGHNIAYAQPLGPHASAPMYTASSASTGVTINTGEWDAHFCGCFSFCVPNCCMAWCCPCVSAAQIASRVGYNYWAVLFICGAAWVADLALYTTASATFSYGVQAYYDSNDYTYGDYYVLHYSVSNSGLYTIPMTGHLAYVLSIAVFIAYWQLRSRVRSMYQLPGSCLGDCCASFCCSCCSLAQMATHVKSYKPGSCDFGPSDELAAYAD